MHRARVAALMAISLTVLLVGGCGGGGAGEGGAVGSDAAQTDPFDLSAGLPHAGVSLLITSCASLDYVTNGPDEVRFRDPLYLDRTLARTGPKALRDEFRVLSATLEAYSKSLSEDDSKTERIARLAVAWGPEAKAADARIGAWATTNC